VPSQSTLAAFALVSVAVMVSPGPSNIFLLAHGVRNGRRAALAAMAGIEVAAAVRILLCAAGLSAVLASSALAFGIIRWAGVAYLVVLGIRAVRSRAQGAHTDAPATRRLRVSAGQGLLVGLANPKMIVFFLAFFPQFVDPARGSAVTQMLVLGAVFWLIGVAWDLGFALLAGQAGHWLQRRAGDGRVLPRVEGSAYLGMAVVAAVTGGRPS